MKTREQVIGILRKEKDRLLQEWPILQLELFGSVARGDNTGSSDVDLLVSLKTPLGYEFFDMEETFSSILGVKVDLIPKEGVKPRYWEKIAPDVIEIFH